jgi:RNA polymerase sigma factor (sigma-70 family)
VLERFFKREKQDAVAVPYTIEELMTEYGDMVLQLAYFYLHDKGLAEDVYQEVFLRVYKHLDGFRGDCSIKTWICRITTNVCRDRVRSWAHRNLLFIGDETVHTFMDHANTEDSVMDAFDRQQILHAVLNLPIPLREVTILYYYKGFDTKEIAEILKVSEGTVRSRMHRAREKLKQILEKGGVAREVSASRFY